MSKPTRACVLQGEVFIFKLGTINGLPTSAIVVGEIPTLTHEVWDDSMEGRALVAKALFSCAKGSEVLCCLWHHICPNL